MGRVIVVEDNIVFRDYVCNILSGNKFETVCASDCNSARKLFATISVNDMVLADLRLPDGDGIQLLEELRQQGKYNPYIIMTDYAEVMTAVRSMKSGAEDYIPKKLLADKLPAMLRKLQKKVELHSEPVFLRESDKFKEIDWRLRIVAATDISVLILGENGTGKKHMAEKIHALSKRASKPFVTVDCGLLSENLAASALFGHEKGAFTGAERRKDGFWAEAEGGTLFLDEIGNLPLGVQQMLLCAIQDKRYRPVGGAKDRKADVRIISATNENLESSISERRFRQDLYFRLREHTVYVPPLRECKEDILPLASFFREHFNKEYNKEVKGFDVESRKRLLVYPWPGNVRELKQAVQSAVLFTKSEIVTANMLNLNKVNALPELDLALKGEEVERKRICLALEKTSGNRKQAAKLLGISRSTLYEKMELYGIRE